jgi:hypothetical protein
MNFIILTFFTALILLNDTPTSLAQATTTTTTPKFELDHVYNDIVNPHNFSYLQNPEHSVCNHEKTLIIVYVHSAPENHKKRVAIR